MHHSRQIQYYRTASQSAIAVARQFNDCLERASIYNAISEEEANNHRQVSDMLQRISVRLEQHIRQNLNEFTIRRITGNDDNSASDLPAMVALEKELAPRLSEAEQRLTITMDGFLRHLHTGLTSGKLRDTRLLHSIVRLRQRIGGNVKDEDIKQIISNHTGSNMKYLS